jgi:hypothetical protein
LTANTSTNLGRQFYKCSLPEGENCGFFQWQDGMEGNWNNNNNDCTPSGGQASSTYSRGDIRDMFEANRRVFGHQSFRKGQREVIEKAIDEVFDLRPQAIIEALDLLTTSYLPTAAYGHFGRTDQDFPWERLNRTEELRQASGL